MESKKINQLATELSPSLDDLTIIGDPTTGISRKITLSQMASLFTGTVEEYASLAAFPLVGTADTIYIALDTNVLYRWNGTAYVELSPNIVSSLEFNDANGFDGTINLVGSVATLTITTALTLGSLPFIGTSGALTQDNNNLFYDDANNRLGIGTNTPTTPLDVFGSGIISRINGTSTNNGFLGFASAGSNKWSVGNVQSDHRFRIFSEANTSELVSLLQTGEFGIGIANPTTKLHLDGGASALIANLDANVSVAKSLSFRSDNSNRINLEVSGTESGSNVGADFFIRRYSDAGALIDTPFTITRSTGLITLATALAGLSASFSSTGSFLTNSGATTTEKQIIVANTGGSMRAGVESSAGGAIQLDTLAYAAVFGNQANAATQFTTNGTARLTITSGGDVGIGITTPQLSAAGRRVLDINGTSTSLIALSSGGAYKSYLFNDGTNLTIESASLILSTSFTDRLVISGAGVVKIGNLAGAGSRTVTADASGNLSAASDSRLKQEDLEHKIEGLSEILKIQPRAYKWLSDIENKGENAATEIGFFANEVCEIIPSAAPKGNDGYYGFYDRAIIAALVKSVQELSAKITQLEKN
jgi:hypothetical protein